MYVYLLGVYFIIMNPDEIKRGFDDIADRIKKASSNSNTDEEVKKFFKLLEKATGKNPLKESTEIVEEANEEDCPDGDDCSDFISECCNAGLVTVFGTVPLKVKCIKCEKTYVLRELLNTQKT